MEKIMENSSDLHVVARKVYAKPSDAYAYSDSDYKTKISADELYDTFVKGMIVIDAGVEYKPISVKVASKVATVSYVKAGSTNPVIATVKSE